MPTLVSVQKIWDGALHNAFTDLIDYKGNLIVAFREGEMHVGDRGKIRLLQSPDGESWKPLAYLSSEGIDLRDPMLSIMPDGTLMLSMGGAVYEGEKTLSRRTYATFSTDGVNWSPIQTISEEWDWIWRVTWYQGTGYAISYRQGDGGKWEIQLMKTEDGTHFTSMKKFNLSKNPTEGTIRFTEEGKMVVLLRRSRIGAIGWSLPPYDTWQWNDIPHQLGGPNFLILPDNTVWASSRKYVKVNGEWDESVVLARMTLTSYKPLLQFPSADDSGYPGMVYRDGLLYISYYASHEGKSSIYLAKVKY